MTNTSCPHCGAKLPPTADKFCPECRNSLDEPPARNTARNTALPRSAAGDEDSTRGGLGCLLILGGLAAQIPGVLALLRGNWGEAVYTGGVGIVLVIGGFLHIRKELGAGHVGWNGPDRAPHDRRRSVRPSAIVAGSVVVLGLLVALVRLWIAPPSAGPAEVSGVAEPGDYRNPYFGFRLRYGADWQDVSADARKRAAALPDAAAGQGLVLLALAWAPVGGMDAGTSLILGAEPLPASDRITSGAEYLRRTLPLLQQRRDRPKEVKEEPQAKIGGLTYDRMSLKRPWEDGEVLMTFWVTVTRNYVVVITGTYGSPEGLQAIEALLARGVSEDAGR